MPLRAERRIRNAQRFRQKTRIGGSNNPIVRNPERVSRLPREDGESGRGIRDIYGIGNISIDVDRQRERQRVRDTERIRKHSEHTASRDCCIGNTHCIGYSSGMSRRLAQSVYEANGIGNYPIRSMDAESRIRKTDSIRDPAPKTYPSDYGVRDAERVRNLAGKGHPIRHHQFRIVGGAGLVGLVTV